MPKTKTSEKPWEALGVSRSKFYRDQKKPTGAKKRGRGRPRKAAPTNGQKWMIDKEAAPVTADGAAAQAEGAPAHLWQAIDQVSYAHESLVDEALVKEFVHRTNHMTEGDVFVSSHRMTEALRRAVSSC